MTSEYLTRPLRTFNEVMEGQRRLNNYVKFRDWAYQNAKNAIYDLRISAKDNLINHYAIVDIGNMLSDIESYFDARIMDLEDRLL